MTGTETGLLPAEFADLEPFVTEFSLPSERDRYRKRLSLTLVQLAIFYNAIKPRMDAVMDGLKQYPADDIPALPVPVRNLYHLAQSYFEASHPIELNWQGTDLDDAFPQDRIVYKGPSLAEC